MHSAITIGCRALDVMDTVQGARIPSWVVYPAPGPAPGPAQGRAQGPEQIERFGPYELAVTMGAPVAGDRLPLVVISHGNGGSPWTHRGLAAHLARAGFVVALLEHPGNSRSDNSLAFTAANLANRPRHLGLVLDAVFQDEQLGARLAPAGVGLATAGVGLIGHSIGAYTALALAGGRPTSLPNEEPDGQARPVPVARDPRVRALVLLAPASIWYRAEGALAGADVPILMRTGARDAHTHPLHGAIVLRGVPDPARIDHQVVPNAGHFSFQSPFPPAMTRPDFPPSQDPPGFDRAAYEPVLSAEIATFLRASLAAD